MVDNTGHLCELPWGCKPWQKSVILIADCYVECLFTPVRASPGGIVLGTIHPEILAWLSHTRE